MSPICVALSCTLGLDKTVCDPRRVVYRVYEQLFIHTVNYGPESALSPVIVRFLHLWSLSLVKVRLLPLVVSLV
jgi:hypothetical protein